MKNWTIGKRIIIGFASVLFILAALGIFTRLRLATIQGEAKDISENLPTLESVANMMEVAKDNIVLAYKHIYSASAEDKDRLETTIKANSEANAKALDAYEKAATTKESLDLVAQTKTSRDNYLKLFGEFLTASRVATNAEASAKLCQRARAELDPLMTLYADSLDKLWDAERKESEASVATIAAGTRQTNLWITIGLGIALGLGIAMALTITRSIGTVLRRVSGALNEGAQQVASAAGQVSSTSQSLAEGASEQAASLEETSSSLEELSSMTQRNSDNATKASDLGKQARHAAEKGATDMQSMSTAMDDIKTSSDDIAKIIKTIDEIAFQTNILALNAAVEAARAGEAGMGFAVVADEVRNLAQRSAQAAKETSSKIEGAITKTAQGVEISAKVGEALSEIVAKVRQVDELVAEVAGASREQTQGITQINTAVSQMDKVTQGNAASAEESAAAAEELNAQAETMKESVGHLLHLVGTEQQSAAPRTTKSAHKPSSHPLMTAGPKKAATPLGNGHARHLGNGKPAAVKLTPAARSSEIPLEGDFKEF